MAKSGENQRQISADIGFHRNLLFILRFRQRLTEYGIIKKPLGTIIIQSYFFEIKNLSAGDIKWEASRSKGQYFSARDCLSCPCSKISSRMSFLTSLWDPPYTTLGTWLCGNACFSCVDETFV